MRFKTPNCALSSALSLVEVVLSVGLLILLIATVTLNTNSRESRQKARDNVRLSDLQTLDRVINEYILTNGWVYPDTGNVLRQSTIIAGNASSPSVVNQGWILANFSPHTSSLPIDPVNDATYHYEFIHNGSSYELNARLEFLQDRMVSDGGNDPARYEIGNNLNLISP